MCNHCRLIGTHLRGLVGFLNYGCTSQIGNIMLNLLSIRTFKSQNQKRHWNITDVTCFLSIFAHKTIFVLIIIVFSVCVLCCRFRHIDEHHRSSFHHLYLKYNIITIVLFDNNHSWFNKCLIIIYLLYFLSYTVDYKHYLLLTITPFMPLQ